MGVGDGLLRGQWRCMTPQSVNDWLVRVASPICGVALAAYLILTRQSIQPYDVTLIVALVGARLIAGKAP